MDEFLRNPYSVAGATSLGIGLPILILYIKGWLPTRTQDREKSVEIERLHKELERKDTLIASLPTTQERDNLVKELQAVRTGLRGDLNDKQKQLDNVSNDLKMFYTSAMQQQEAVYRVAETLGDLAKHLPVLTVTIEYLLKERNAGH